MKKLTQTELTETLTTATDPVVLRDLDLSGLSFEDADLRQADLAGSDLTGCDLSDAMLGMTGVAGCDLTGVEHGVTDMGGLVGDAQTTWPYGYVADEDNCENA